MGAGASPTKAAGARGMDPLAVLEQTQALNEVDAPAAALLDRPEDDWMLVIRAGAWLSRVNGTYTASPGSTGVVVQNELQLDNYEAAFLGEAAMSWDRWRIQLAGFSFATSATSIASSDATVAAMNISAGDALSSTFDAWSVAGEVAYRIYRPLSDQPLPWNPRVSGADNTTADGHYKTDLGFAPVIGGRGLYLNQGINDLTTGDQVTSAIAAAYLTYGFAVDIRINLRPHNDVMKELVVEAQGLWGTGFDSGEWLVDVRATASLMFTDSVGLYLGYRLLNFKAVESGATFDGSIQGLVAGLALRF